jgi:hypothetical protein
LYLEVYFFYFFIGKIYKEIGRAYFQTVRAYIFIHFFYLEIYFLDFLTLRDCFKTAAVRSQPHAKEITMQKIWLLMLLTFVFLFTADHAQAAVGCDLNDPDKDVARLFPESTSYKTNYLSIDKLGGDALLKEIEKRLGDSFQGLYETADVPYTLYEIFKDKEKIGYIHGVNQKGKYGGIQVFLVLDMEGKIKSFYFQKLTSRAASQLRELAFGKQFNGLSLVDFYPYDVKASKSVPPGKVDEIKNPVPEAEDDFRASLRATKKNLILMDEFVYANKHLQSFKAK